MTDSILDTLRRARERIAVPERWTKGCNSRDTNGVQCSPRAPSAACWCLDASMLVEEGYLDASHWLAQWSGAPWRDRSHSIWNDAPARTHAEVLAALDEAIQARADEVGCTPDSATAREREAK